MIVGVGIDIIEVSRVIEKVNRNDNFKGTVFSELEIAYCDAQSNRDESYAARFAAKEAFLKAIGHGLSQGHQLSDIEITNDETGKPSIHLKGSYRTKLTENNWNNIFLSISHLQNIACAVVVIEQ